MTIEHSAPPTGAEKLLSELPGGVALFDDRGSLIDANDVFFSTLADAHRPGTEFATMFGVEPAACTPHQGHAVAIDDRHIAVTTKHVSGWGWLCQLHDVSAWVSSYAAAQKAAERDPLTGLPNRSLIGPELTRAVTQEGSTALLMIDLDRFKWVNDTLGHGVGDTLLRKVAQRLSGSVRPSDMAARLGGDEFAVLQTGVSQPEGAATLAKRLVEVLGRPYVVDGHMIDIGASIGVAIADATSDADTMFKQADIALYRAKNAGRARYTFFEQRMDDEMQDRRALEVDLRRAIAFRQFELYYQPQFDLASNSVTGMEALIRWRHPERGMVPPGEFITVAEETGLIVPIGEWVIRQALEDASGWPGDLTIAVNVSAKQLASGKLVGTVRNAIANAGIQGSRVEVEITESVLMSDTQQCVETLHSLRALGVRVSMDDFGTGYSSLSYLRSFPFDKIKIDQSFTRSGDPERSDGIIRAIAAIGLHLGMTTIAEGVETRAQMGEIAASGCGSVQGYFISRPVPAQDVLKLIDRLNTTDVAASKDVEPTVVTLFPPETGIHRLVYYSRNAILGLDEEVREAVDQILTASKRNNASAGISGALMFTDGYFAQVLEGQRDAVEEVFERIQLDDRHADVQLLSFEAVDGRLFPNWAMAFVGHARGSREKFGHYAATSGFDFNSADGDQIVVQLRALLVDEEKLSLRKAA